MKKFAARMKELRIKAGFTSAEDFAYEKGIDRAQWGKWERGQIEPRLFNIFRICDALGVTPAEFFSKGFK